MSKKKDSLTLEVAFFEHGDVLSKQAKTFFKFVTPQCQVDRNVQPETDSVGGRAQDLHQHVLVGARPLHGLPQLLHGVDDGRVEHGEDGLLEISGQLALQHVHQLLGRGQHV